MVILTDLSDVLIHGLYGADEIIAERYGKNVAEAFWQRHLETEEDFRELMRGKMSEDDYWQRLLQGDDWPFGIREIEDVFSENLRRDVPDTLQVYQRITSHPRSLLHRHDILLGAPEIYIISDHIEERIEEIYQYHPDIFKVAQKTFWSCELGNIKMDEAFFPQLLRVFDMPIDEFIFVDDNAYNTTAASLAGIASIYFKNAKQLEKTLRAYGFEFAPVDS
ncbi:hypothetical protein IKF88_01190 [Candidatus Saccharibacteria bacterium]|nr:hypothetical protein [Candidatus Saccharibacteria bacterium]